ncbi:heterokaryon incompatibility protein-domain-containing protein, partial [Leptodontidium sp. MPI-SDFR-AT-0119]
PQQTFGSAQHVPAERSLEDYTAIIQGWVHDCIQTHTKCGLVELSKSDLPFRVLCIAGNSVVLVHAQDTIIDRYATLSHRWGQKHPVTTTEENIARWMEEIPWEELPKTFQDAICIARGLGLSFIWIDSLCIIQDNPQDWEKEARRMATIYSNSHLNIAATSSIDALGGCIFSRKLPSLPLHSGDRRQILLQGSENTSVFVRPSFRPTHARFTTPNYASGFSLDIRTFPLLTRAWVFQERFLAPRTLHFHSTEIVMECRSHLRCECTGVDKVSAKRFDLETTSDAHVLDQWMEVVEEYSKLAITKDSDRLPAILGVATRFQQRLRSRYIAGLWEVDLARQILWEV